MTKKELQKIYYLDKEIKELKSGIEAMKKNSGQTYGENKNMVRELDNLKSMLEKNLIKRLIEHERLLEFINLIEDAQIRFIFTLRFIKRMSWQKIAFMIGHYDEQYPRRKVDRFLKKYHNNK